MNASVQTGPSAVEFDFGSKQCRAIAPDAAPEACRKGLACWVDLDSSDPAHARAVLEQLGVNPHAIDEVLGPDREGRHDIYPDCLHVALSAVKVGDGTIATAHVDVIVARTFIATIHKGPVEFIEQVRRTYQQDFERFAKTLSFLLFEVFDHLIENYRRAIRAFEAQVEEFQARIFADANDDIFSLVGRTTRNLLVCRAILLSTRDVAHELATRKSPFVAESAQPFLENMVGTLERLSSDVTIQREVLAEILNLYMGIVSHRTNKVVNRLTTLSMVFLPLTFLCGVYGMNFKNLPELEWEYGYALFWVVALSIALALITFMRKMRWL